MTHAPGGPVRRGDHPAPDLHPRADRCLQEGHGPHGVHHPRGDPRCLQQRPDRPGPLLRVAPTFASSCEPATRRLVSFSASDAEVSRIALYKASTISILPLPLGRPGGVAEWSKAAVLKTAERKLRGFESLLLRRLDNQIASRKWSWAGRRLIETASLPGNKFWQATRRGGRVAEGTGLLNRHTGFTGIEGSNPFLSATARETATHDYLQIAAHYVNLSGDTATKRLFVGIRSSMDRAPVYGTGG